MSRTYQPKNQSYANIQVMTGGEVFKQDENGKSVKEKSIAVVGMVEKTLPNAVVGRTKDGKTYFKEDTNKLNKKTKNELVDVLQNQGKSKAYLVDIKQTLKNLTGQGAKPAMKNGCKSYNGGNNYDNTKGKKKYFNNGKPGTNYQKSGNNFAYKKK